MAKVKVLEEIEREFIVLLLGLFGAVKGRLLFFFGMKFAGFLETSISPKTLL